MNACIAEVVFRDNSSCAVIVELSLTVPAFGTLRTNEAHFFDILASSPDVPARLTIPGRAPIEILIGE